MSIKSFFKLRIRFGLKKARFHGDNINKVPHVRLVRHVGGEKMLIKLKPNLIKFDCHSLRKISRFTDSHHQVDVTFSNGSKLKFECGKYARFADGSMLASIGDTNVLVAAVSKTKPTPSPLLPLTVDYRQKAAAIGKIPANFLRRELGPTEKEILTGRMIDRSLRPLFPAGYYYETQLVCNLLSSDGINDPDVVAINSASAALHISDIPWKGPVGAVRVAFSENSDVIINPTRKEIEEHDFNMVVTSNEDKRIVMIDGCANKVGLLPDMFKALKTATTANQSIIQGIKAMRDEFPIEKREVERYYVPTPAHIEAAQILAEVRVKEIFTEYAHDKTSRDDELRAVQKDVLEKLKENFPEEDAFILSEAYTKVVKNLFKSVIKETGRRIDGRQSTDLRDISCQTDLYRPLHGSALFQRGQTQVLCTLTLDSLESSLKADPVTLMTGGLKEKNFFLHYNFPSFATNETGRVGTFGRREIGHGALAEKALRPAMPDDFPYTTRLQCDVLESNGSSSMASVCAGSLALMDGGIPITHPTAGVAIGLINLSDENASPKSEETSGQDDQAKELSKEEQFMILTDILGIEDYLGEMDFKMAGPPKGITALQLDVKLSRGLPIKLVSDALIQGNQAKKKILGIMNNVINQPNVNKRDNWPIIETIEVPPHRRSRLFGYGMKVLKKLSGDLGVRLTQEDHDTNKFLIFAPDQNSYREAKAIIDELLTADDYEKKMEFRGVYSAKVVDVVDSGIKVVLFPGMDPAFIPNRELNQKPIQHPSAIGLTVGTEIKVKYFGRDPVSGQMRLSRRVLQALEPLGGNFIKTDN